MSRNEHAADGARPKEAKKDCIRCGTELDLSGTKPVKEYGETRHVDSEGEIRGVTAGDREFDWNPQEIAPSYYKAGLYCYDCNDRINEGTIERDEYEADGPDTLAEYYE